MQDNKDYTFTGYRSASLQKARALRERMTKQERHLWFDFLRHYPIKFYRQRPIDAYIVDFYCHAAKLVIELDGSQHYSDEGLAYDAERTKILNQYGLEVLRFSNTEIDRNFPVVCEKIDHTVRQRLEVFST